MRVSERGEIVSEGEVGAGAGTDCTLVLMRTGEVEKRGGGGGEGH